jgi:hypothetical protein
MFFLGIPVSPPSSTRSGLPGGIRQLSVSTPHQVVPRGVDPVTATVRVKAAVQTNGEEGVFGCFECGPEELGVPPTRM